jgi:hypothetical protein
MRNTADVKDGKTIASKNKTFYFLLVLDCVKKNMSVEMIMSARPNIRPHLYFSVTLTYYDVSVISLGAY